jgi:LPS export ABC transporter protein LptC
MPKHTAPLRYLSSLTPIFLMASLSLLSIILVKQSSITTKNEAVKPNSNEHNYYLNKFFSSQFKGSGELTAYIGGKSALHFEQPLQLSVQDLSFYYLNKQNQYQYQGHSNSALIDDSGDTVKLFDQAEIVRTQLSPNISFMVLQSNYLELTQSPDTLSSNQSVKIYNDKSTITSGSLGYHNLEQQLDLTGKIKIQIKSKN